MIHRHVQERGEVFLLPLQVGVEERLVTLAAAPKHVALAAEPLRGFEGLLHLRRSVGEDVGVGIGRGATHVARVGEEVGRAPEQLYAGGALEAARVIDEGVEVAVGFRERATLGGDVAIVERPERRADFLEELERGIHPGLRDRNGIGTLFPRPLDRAGSERIAARAAEGMPVGDGETQVRGHRLPVDHLVGIVVPERERVRALRALVGDGLDAGKVGAGFFHEESFSTVTERRRGEPARSDRRAVTPHI